MSHQGSRIDEFYRNGQNITNTITVGASDDKGGMHLSFANLKSTGIVEGNSFDRKTINLGFTYNLTEKLNFRGNINYSNEYNKNPPNVANQDNTIPTSLMAMANSMPLSLMKENKYDLLGNEYVYSRFRNRTNPYFVVSDQFHNIQERPDFWKCVG